MTWTSARNAFEHFFYTKALKPLFFRRDPEDVHDRMTAFGSFLGKHRLSRTLIYIAFSYKHPMLKQRILGIDFANPLGLAAGFDKNAELTQILPSVGFGFAEVGSVTGERCEGNVKPRLWRLPQSKSLQVYYGLKNNGAEEIASRLRSLSFAIPTGISVAKTNCAQTVATANGIADYVKAFTAFVNIGHYLTVNISCPNAFGGQPFTEPESLDLLLTQLDQISTKKPIFLKLSPDLTFPEIDALLTVIQKHRVHGFISSNLTKNRNNPHIIEPIPSRNGGLSGKIVEAQANALIRHLYEKTRGKYVIVGCGGIFSAEDAYKKIRLGASLLQLISGMIFEGPQVISQINEGLVALLKKDGFTNITEAVGADVKSAQHQKSTFDSHV